MGGVPFFFALCASWEEEGRQGRGRGDGSVYKAVSSLFPRVCFFFSPPTELGSWMGDSCVPGWSVEYLIYIGSSLFIILPSLVCTPEMYFCPSTFVHCYSLLCLLCLLVARFLFFSVSYYYHQTVLPCYSCYMCVCHMA